MLKGLELNESDIPSVFDPSSWPELKQLLSKKFKSKSRKEWEDIFKGTDACVTPVLSLEEAELHSPTAATNGPLPAPILSRTPATASMVPSPTNGQHTVEILKSLGIPEHDIKSITTPKSKL